MDRIFSSLASLTKAGSTSDNDGIDRLNYLYTCLLLVTFSILISTKQYVGKPIVCWTPTHFKGVHDSYADSVCWISNTYYQPLPDVIPEDYKTRQEQEIGYYQWIPFVLLLQALMFFFPSLVWRAMNAQSDVNVCSIIKQANSTENVNPDQRKKTIEMLARHLELCLEHHREYRSGCSIRFRHFLARRCCCFVFGQRYGNYLTCVYIAVKFMYIINILLQLFLFNFYLQTEYTFYGIEVIIDLLMGKDWKASGKFPRVTLCDFQVKRVGQTHMYTVQCVLPINILNEKMFIVLWFWYVIVLIFTIGNVCAWLAKLSTAGCRHEYIKKYLKLLGVYKRQDSKQCRRFTNDYLRHDGIFIVRLVALNVGTLVAAEMLSTLWRNYLDRFRPMDSDPSLVLSTDPLPDYPGRDFMPSCPPADMEKKRFLPNISFGRKNPAPTVPNMDVV